MARVVVTQLDPAGCACPKCIGGTHVPLDWAHPGIVLFAAYGVVKNLSGHTPEELIELYLRRV